MGSFVFRCFKVVTGVEWSMVWEGGREREREGEIRDGEGEKSESKGKVVDVGGSKPAVRENGEEGEGVRVGEVMVQLGGGRRSRLHMML